MVDAVSNNNIIDFNSLDEALAGGDLYDVILALGIETADGLDKAVKDKIKAMKDNNEQLKQLRDLQTMFSGVKSDSNGDTIQLSADQKAELKDFLVKNPDFWNSTHGGMNLYNSDGKSVDPANWDGSSIKSEVWGGMSPETIKTQLQNKIDTMTSNAQLDQVELQSLVSKYNNQIDMVSTLEKKREDLASSIIRNMG